MMDLEYVKKTIHNIRTVAADKEAAHEAEDRLHKEFISLVAKKGPHELAVMAKEILKTDNISFNRWCG